MLFLLTIFCASWGSSHAAMMAVLPFELKYEMYHVNASAVCYKEVGCFTTDAPFFTLPHRPVPPPEDPVNLKAYVRFYDRINPHAFRQTYLSGDLYLKNSTFDAERELTVFLVGCWDDFNASWPLDVKDALLKKKDVNVFVFGTFIKRKSVLQNTSNLRVLGYQLARFIKFLQVEYNLDTMEKAWIIGFGCGAHMAGYTGRRSVLKRITGLDPTNFLFEGQAAKVRLGRSDAVYVDVHHTDATHSQTRRGTGYVQPIGHVDFYYNGGFRQPGCPTGKTIPLDSTRAGFFNCDHQRAVEYFKQAILLHDTNLYIWGRNITTMNYIHSQSDDGKDGVRLVLAALLRDKCNMTICVPVGLESNKSSIRGIQVVTTMPYPPWYSTTDQTERETFGILFRDEVITRWLHSMIPEIRYKDPQVPILPALKPACYGTAFWTLGCFNQSDPWMIMRNRPMSAPNPPGELRIAAWFYSRENRYEKFDMSLYPRVPPDMILVPFKPERMTFLIIHGFYNSGRESWIAPLKDALLNRTDANVIVCDWGGGSVTLDYLQASGNLRMASRLYSNMLQMFIDHAGLNTTRVHLIGHSLGAHIAGLIAKSIPGIFQITALDPAQPWFVAADPVARVTKEDANFVVGVHSDAPPFLPDLGFGLAKEVGHIDFYINGGFKQPKCMVPTAELTTPNFTNIFDLVKPVSQIFVKLVLCPHQSAVDIFTEAVKRHDCVFWGQAIKMNNMIASSHLSTDGDAWEAVYYRAGVETDCTSDSCSPMGLDTYFWPARGSFVVITRSTDPYCIYESHVKTIQKTLLVIPKSQMMLEHRDEFFPGITSRAKRLSLVPLPYIAINFETFEFIGVVLALVDKFIRPLYEVFNVVMWSFSPVQYFMILASNWINKNINLRSVTRHSKTLMDHLERIEAENEEGNSGFGIKHG